MTDTAQPFDPADVDISDIPNDYDTAFLYMEEEGGPVGDGQKESFYPMQNGIYIDYNEIPRDQDIPVCYTNDLDLPYQPYFQATADSDNKSLVVKAYYKFVALHFDKTHLSDARRQAVSKWSRYARQLHETEPDMAEGLLAQALEHYRSIAGDLEETQDDMSKHMPLMGAIATLLAKWKAEGHPINTQLEEQPLDAAFAEFSDGFFEPHREKTTIIRTLNSLDTELNSPDLDAEKRDSLRKSWEKNARKLCKRFPADCEDLMNRLITGENPALHIAASSFKSLNL